MPLPHRLAMRRPIPSLTALAGWLQPRGVGALIVLWFAMVGPLFAQAKRDASWRPEVESRLKAIYERGEERPARFSAEWLPDSSGYTVDQRAPGADKATKATYDVRTGERLPTPPDERAAVPREPQRSPDGTRELQIDGRALVVREVATGKRITLLSPAAGREVSYQRATWSPDGRRVLFVEVDATDVRKRAVLDASDPSYPKVHQHRFARVGETIERWRVGVVDGDGQHLTWLPVPAPAEGSYLGQLEWLADSAEVLVEQQSRFRNRREFFLLKTSGEITRTFHEENEAWTDASQQKNAGLTWIRGGQEFVVVNETDGWRHAHRWSREGKALAVLTPGEYDLIDRAWIDEAGGWYYFYASPDNATQKHLYRVPLDGAGTLERITPADQPGTHDYTFSPDGKWAFHTYSRLDSPPVVDLVELPQHRVARVLQDQHQLRERMKTVITRPTEFLQLAIGGGVTMDAWLLKPRDFDPAKKYPVFVYVYGEPHAQTVLDEWGGCADRVPSGRRRSGVSGRVDRQPGHASTQGRVLAARGVRQSGVTFDRRAGGRPPGTGSYASLCRPLARRHLGLERWWLEHAERAVSQAGLVPRGHRRRAQAPTAPLQRVVPGDLHAHAGGESGWLSSRGRDQLRGGAERRSVDRDGFRGDQHAHPDHRGAGRSVDRARQAV